MYFYTSDLHFGDQVTFERTRARKERFKDVTEMTEAIVENINRKVMDKDILFILGDVAENRGYDPTQELEKIKCKKVLIRGNADSALVKHRHFREQFVDVRRAEFLQDKSVGLSVNLLHFPMADWNGKLRGAWHFYGHVHDGLGPDGQPTEAYRFMEAQANCYNVGVDVNGFMPVSFEEIIDQMKRQGRTIWTPENVNKDESKDESRNDNGGKE